jgi:inner membrane protein
MSPVTHFLASWLVANASNQLNRRERTMIVLAGVAPDLDGLGWFAEFLTGDSGDAFSWYSAYHHTLGHTMVFGLALILLGLFLTSRRYMVALLILLSFHLHLLADLAGSRGPDGYQWPIFYWLPFSSLSPWIWSGQWALNGWPNFLITATALFISFWLAWKRGFSPVGIFSASADRSFIDVLRKRFPYRDSK